MFFLALWTVCTLGALALMLAGMFIVKRADARADAWLARHEPPMPPDNSRGRGSFDVSGS